MKRISKFIYLLSCAFICVSSAQSSSLPNNDSPRTFVGSTFRGSVTNLASNSTAYSISGEAGPKNFRVGGALGLQLDCNQFFKVSADYLRQDINYSYFSGNSYKWVNQGTLSAGYLYDLYQYQYDPQFVLNGYFSHAPSKTLNTRSGTLTNTAGVFQIFTNNRRIAGSNAGGISPGASVSPWMGSRIGLEVNYDNTRYDKVYSPKQNAVGLGGTVKFNQAITDNIVFDTSAAFRKPFNNYEAKVRWDNIPYYGMWGLGVFGDYVVGKRSLPNTYNVGASVNYSFDGPVACRLTSARTDLHSFTAQPGVYLPQVLAIADEGVTFVTPVAPPAPVPPPAPAPTPTPVVCSPVPAVIGTIPTLDDNVSTTFDASTVFSPGSGSGLTYSISVSPSPTPPASVTINPTTGLITLSSSAVTESLSAVVTATNECGSVSSNTFTIVLND